MPRVPALPEARPKLFCSEGSPSGDGRRPRRRIVGNRELPAHLPRTWYGVRGSPDKFPALLRPIGGAKSAWLVFGPRVGPFQANLRRRSDGAAAKSTRTGQIAADPSL